MIPVALTIAGSDPSGGAGIQADLKTFHQFGVYGEAVITLITVQNTRTVSRVDVLDPGLVGDQLAAVLEDIPPHAAKTGALGSASVISAVARVWKQATAPLVVDPVMISKHGAPLIAEEARAALVADLLPVSYLVTPNVHEAEVLAGFAIRNVRDARRAAEWVARLGPGAVLVKGGHLEGEADAVDVLFDSGAVQEFRTPRFETQNTHGTGCTFSAAITAELAKGTALAEAVLRAKRFIAEAIRTNPGLGGGFGPVNHFSPIDG